MIRHDLISNTFHAIEILKTEEVHRVRSQIEEPEEWRPINIIPNAEQ